MTSGSRLEIVNSSKSVGIFHDVRACSGDFLVMRWMMIEKVPGSLPCGASFALLLSLCGGWYGWAALPLL
jgi:hypothetical protein